MMKIKKFIDYINEKSIGSESIRSKYYSDMDKKLFYSIVNIDPTSIRKKEFSKPGKYFKWLMSQYKKGNLKIYPYLTIDNNVFTITDKSKIKEKQLDNEVLIEYYKDKIDNLKNYLFIFSTSLGKTILKSHGFSLDIMTYKSIDYFEQIIKSIKNEWIAKSDKGKSDLVYEDSNIIILIPMNFTSCWEWSKNTDWCTQTVSAYANVKERAILYRFLNKKNNKKFRLTWYFDYNQRITSKHFNWACEKYPEISGSKILEHLDVKSPFDFDLIYKYFSGIENNESNKFILNRYHEIKENLWNYMTPEVVEKCKNIYSRYSTIK